MVEIVNFEEAKQPHALKRRDKKAEAIKKAFAAARTDGLDKPKKKRRKKKKK